MTLAFRLRPLLGGALLGLNLAASAAPAPAAITFDTTPRAGQHHRQTMEMRATVKMHVEATPEATDEQRAKIAAAADQVALASPMVMSMQMQQTMQVGQPDAQGWLPMTVASAIKGGQMQLGGKTMPMPNPKGKDISITSRFNPADFAFEIQGIEGSPELNEFMRKQGAKTVSDALQLHKALRERPLKVGDSIEVPLAMALPVPLPGGAGAMNGQLRYTLARVDRGVAYFDLGMDLKLDLDMPAPTPAAAASAPEGEAASAPAAGSTPKAMHMTIRGGGKGTSSLRLADRLPLATQLNLDMQMSMNMPDNGLMRMDMTMTTLSKGESLAKPAAKKKP